ncbi:MAG: hypothetical protein MHPSP_001216, partial [Paramarteilia canceri]
MNPPPSKASYIIFGFDAKSDSPYLACITRQGVKIENDVIGTGMTAYSSISLAQEKISKLKEQNQPITKDIALNILSECIRSQTKIEKEFGFNHQFCIFNKENGFEVSKHTMTQIELGEWELQNYARDMYNIIS